MGLQQFERRLERLVEGAFAKAFRGQLQPVELGRRLTREMDLRRAVGIHGFIVPNRFNVFLSSEDFDRFAGFGESLERELVASVREHAGREGYQFVGPVKVDLHLDPQLSVSTFAIESELVEGDDRPNDWLVFPDGRRVGVGSQVLTIGRLPECAIVLDDPNVSRRHAQVRREGDAVFVVDLGSTNGTRVNGIVVREHRLVAGDVISVGTTALRFEPS
ncbi:MAG: DUF3662 and FHA domain-containing protein [Acidimicrobiales bacterium]|jgi:hypothetical protein